MVTKKRTRQRKNVEIRPVPEPIKELVRNGLVMMSKKTRQILLESTLELEDIYQSVLEGCVVKRESDETNESRWKYTVIGPSRTGRRVYSAGKICETPSGKRYFLITTHWDKKT